MKYEPVTLQPEALRMERSAFFQFQAFHDRLCLATIRWLRSEQRFGGMDEQRILTRHFLGSDVVFHQRRTTLLQDIPNLPCRFVDRGRWIEKRAHDERRIRWAAVGPLLS